MASVKYKVTEVAASASTQIGFDDVLRGLTNGTKVNFTGEKRSLRNGNVVLVAKVDGRPAPVWLSVANVDRFLGQHITSDGDERSIPEGLNVIVQEGRLAVAKD